MVPCDPLKFWGWVFTPNVWNARLVSPQPTQPARCSRRSSWCLVQTVICPRRPGTSARQSDYLHVDTLSRRLHANWLETFSHFNWSVKTCCSTAVAVLTHRANADFGRHAARWSVCWRLHIDSECNLEFAELQDALKRCWYKPLIGLEFSDCGFTSSHCWLTQGVEMLGWLSWVRPSGQALLTSSTPVILWASQ